MASSGQRNAPRSYQGTNNRNTSYQGASDSFVGSSGPSKILYEKTNTWHSSAYRARLQTHPIRKNQFVKHTQTPNYICGAATREPSSPILQAAQFPQKRSLDSILDEIIAERAFKDRIEEQGRVDAILDTQPPSYIRATATREPSSPILQAAQLPQKYNLDSILDEIIAESAFKDRIEEQGMVDAILAETDPSFPKMPPTNPFISSSGSGLFGAPSQPVASSNPFALASTPATNTRTGGFGAPSQPADTFKPSNNNPFGKPSVFTTSTNRIEAPATSAISNPFKSFSGTTQATQNGTPNGISPFGAPSTQPTTSFGGSSTTVPHNKATPATFATFSAPRTIIPSKSTTSAASFNLSNIAPKTKPLETASTSSLLAAKINQHLKKDNVVAPQWPKSPGDPNQKGAMETLWHSFKAYRSKVRATLIRAGLVDDPDIPKKLSEAIDFKGTCEDMCPEFEQITRIMESDVRAPEKEVGPNGSMIPCRTKMVKALARSAAGQDAPLPMDIRSPAALRRTVDYLFDTVLGDEEGKLPLVHGYLWDRTRAVRRDFVFHSSRSPSELMDQVYCLERITRFHVTSLHLMSDSKNEGHLFDEQQEGEQLSKSLLSLIHAYEDCQAKGVSCENEAEFRAYYLLYNAEEPNILEMAQDWGWKFWGESEVVKLAISFVETLQNTWDKHGPLNPRSATELAQNGFSRFFAIVRDECVSYTMACFAENYFNKVREAALFTIYESYRSLGPATKDWSPAKLNQYLCFDKEQDVIEYVESCGLHFDQSEGQLYLAIGPPGTFSSPSLLKHAYSNSLVERKRGAHSLLNVINTTVYEDPKDFNHVTETVDIDLNDFAADNKATSNHIAFGHTPNVPEPSIFANAPVSAPPLHPFFSAPISTIQPSPFTSKPPTQATTTSQSPLLQSAPPFQAIPTSQPQLFPPAHLPQAQPTSQTPPFKPVSPMGPTTIAQVPAQAQTTARSQTTISQVTTPPAAQIQETTTYLSNTKNDQKDPEPTLPAPNKNGTKETLFAPHAQTHSPLKPAAPQTMIPSAVQVQQQIPKAISFPQSTEAPEKTPKFTGPSAQDIRSSQLDGVANWYVLGREGIIDQITAKWVAQAAREACLEFMKERADQAEQKRKEDVQREADDFRYRFLANKFCRRWRTTTRDNYLRRRARFARKAREEMARNSHAAKIAKAANLVEDFKASTTKSRRPSLESLLDRTGVLDGVHNSEEEIRAIVRDEIRSNVQKKQQQQTHLRRSKPERPTKGPSSKSPIGKKASIAKRGEANDPLRRSLFSDPSYLSGESRTLHMKGNYNVLDDTRQPYNGVQTDYFRLKARGIKTMPDGRPLATSVARMLQQKRSLESLTGQELMEKRRSSLNSSTSEVESAVAQARAKLSGGEKKRKSTMDAEDEELFARAKRVREEMEADSEWYRSETKRLSSSCEHSTPVFV